MNDNHSRPMQAGLEAVKNMDSHQVAPDQQGGYGSIEAEEQERRQFAKRREQEHGLHALEDALKECDFINLGERDTWISVKLLIAKLDAAGFEIRRKED